MFFSTWRPAPPTALPAIGGAGTRLLESVCAALQRAISCHLIYHDAHGDIGPMRIHREMYRDGAHHLICVYASGRHPVFGMLQAKQHFVCEISLDFECKRVRVLLDQYGSSIDGPQTDLARLLEQACTHVQQWQLRKKH